MDTPAVEVADLTKVFRLPNLRRQRVVAVDRLSLKVSAGEIYGFLGPNGSGKSTTMKVLLNLIEPTSGKTFIFGQESHRVHSRNEVGFLPENPYFYRHLTGLETLHFFGQLSGLSAKTIRERSSELLALVELEQAKDRRLSSYSKGMLQRIGLAQALVHEPRLVLLDEPTAGVDPAGSRKIRDIILALKERGKTVVFSSHLLDQVQEVCDRVAIIFRGKLCREGRISDLMAIEDQTELRIRNATQDLQQQLRGLVDKTPGAELLHLGHPHSTLERLFLEVTKQDRGPEV